MPEDVHANCQIKSPTLSCRVFFYKMSFRFISKLNDFSLKITARVFVLDYSNFVSIADKGTLQHITITCYNSALYSIVILLM